MSNTGPALGLEQELRIGMLRAQGPGDGIIASAVCGTPITPSAISRRAVCSPAPSTVSGGAAEEQPGLVRFGQQALSEARSRVSGFSVQDALARC